MERQNYVDILLNFIQKTNCDNLDKNVIVQAQKCFLDLAGVLCAGAKNNSSKKAAEYVKGNYPTDNYKETTKKIQTQEMLIFPGFSLCPLICGTPQKSINFLR
ncbi:MAG: hypothetical protein MSA90_13235 [Faecalicatena sp.]|uniref:hypothetical protein n=1 Tax=Faecalicatena sp. TaxID=2005360 RepID=UPI0025867D61|nr:hypothetical protein [Faecalicatena sp.]MCI6466418.1 hypothetical protein [Faecalicatena sp.]MCI7180559.1 hypothetical protein [Lachnospiraceae bacterium]MDY5619855.1 hypothetical protein [Lachnospiraceae bacterium]